MSTTFGVCGCGDDTHPRAERGLALATDPNDARAALAYYPASTVHVVAVIETVVRLPDEEPIDSPTGHLAMSLLMPRFGRRYDQCDETCTTDCGHCKGAGRPASMAGA